MPPPEEPLDTHEVGQVDGGGKPARLADVEMDK